VQQFEKSLDTLEEFSNKVKETTEALGNVGTSREAFEKLRPAIVDLEKEYGKLYKTIKGAGASSLTDAYQNVIKVANGLDTALEKNKKATKDTGLNVDDLANKIRDAAQKTQPLNDPFGIGALVGVVDKTLAESKEKIQEYNEKVAAEAEAARQQLSDQLEQNTANSLGASLDAALNGGKSGDYKNILRQFYSENFRAVGEFFGGSIGGELAAVVGDKFGKLIFDGLNRVFGGRDAQGKVRDSLDAFFGELLKDSPALINFEGRLKSIFDLDFLRDSDAFVDGSFDDLLQGLSASAQATFSGLGIAFSQFVEGAADQSGQLAAILANNLGGSLNNLQLLVQSTGKSFEDLRGIVIEAFLDGKLSADEALVSLSSIEQIAQKGIPGALGAVDQAFNNLVASGTKGGRAVIDALQDIGSEARELGVKDFGALASLIQEKTGASAEDVKKLFDALTASGITSIDQLEKATVDQLLPVISRLGQVEFPFAEAANEAQTLIEKVDNLPDRIEKKVIFNVETRTDRNSQALIDKGVIPSFGNAGEGT
jgi:flagellar biosynthesis chaperone FliJ